MYQLIFTEEYLNLINKARKRNPETIEGEWHHVFMASLAGDDSETVKLTYAEHYEAHKILALSNPKCKQANKALWCMCWNTGEVCGKRDYGVTAEDYEYARKVFLESIRTRDGLSRTPEVRRLYRLETKEHIAAYNKWYRATHKEQCYKKEKEWRENNKERVKENKRKYRKDNAEKIAEQNHQHYEENKEEILAKNKVAKAATKEHFVNGDIEFKPNAKYNPVKRVGFDEEFYSPTDAAWELHLLCAQFNGQEIRRSAKAYSEGKSYKCGGWQWEFVNK